VIPITMNPIPMTSPTAGGMRKPVVLNMQSVPLGTHQRGYGWTLRSGVGVIGWSMRASPSRNQPAVGNPGPPGQAARTT
jgi:hypothetical protein